MKKRKYLFYFFIVFSLMYISVSTEAQLKLSIMSYNIHHGQDANNSDQLESMAELIKKSGADIVGLQEVDSVCFRSGKIDQAKKLSELTGMHYTYVRHFAFQGGSYGLALLARYPITDVNNNRIPVLTEENGNTRALLSAKVHLEDDKQLIVLIAHLDYRSKKSRLNQSKIIMNMLNNGKYPILLLGDLNAQPSSKTIRYLKQFFNDANKPSELTFPSDKPEAKIDYILVDENHFLKTLDGVVYNVTYSDHRPIYAHIKLSL